MAYGTAGGAASGGNHGVEAGGIAIERKDASGKVFPEHSLYLSQ